MKRSTILLGAAALLFGLSQAVSPGFSHGHGGGGHHGGYYGGGVAAGALIGYGVGAAAASSAVCPPPGMENSYSINYPGACPTY
jgi:hypothetical protein